MTQKIETLPQFSGVNQETIDTLRRQKGVVGMIDPVHISADGELLDGRHRRLANPDWRTEPHPEIKTRQQKILFRIASLTHRPVSSSEIRSYMNLYAETLREDSQIDGSLTRYVAEATGYSESTVRPYLEEQYKATEKRNITSHPPQTPSRTEQKSEETQAERDAARKVEDTTQSTPMKTAHAARRHEGVETFFESTCPHCHKPVGVDTLEKTLSIIEAQAVASSHPFF